jgi:urea transport system substrate-binding protein
MTKIGRRKFLITSFITSAATASTGTFLQGCAPDFADLDTTLSSDSPEPGATGPKATKLGSTEFGATEPAEAKNSAGDKSADTTIKVGILHSLSGTMALSETSLVEAELLAIEEINANGGLLGKQLVAIQEDGASDWPTFAEKAEKLIDNGAAVIFGGLTSESRKAILPVVQAKNSLLWYPGAYEGQECSDHIFYAGASANQQILPAVSWMAANRGKNFFLISSNARTTHDIIKAQLKESGGKVAGEAYVPLVNGVNADMATVVSDIKKALPAGGVIVNSLVGNHNSVFFRALKGAGLTSDKYLVMSLRIAEEEVFQIGPLLVAGHYATWSYFQSIESPENKAWVDKFQGRYGADRVIGAPMESAYTMVHLWAQAVKAAQSTETAAVRKASYGQTFQAPEGPVTIQPNHHTTKRVRIAKVVDDGRFEILHTDKLPIQPIPWSQALSASKGVACDWSDPKKGGKYSIQASR